MTGQRTDAPKGLNRGPSEWGRLYYSSDWAERRRYREYFGLVMGVPLFIMAGFMVLTGVWIYLDHGGYGFMTMMVGMAVVVTFMGYSMIGMTLRRMPFRIYERGFTRTVVPLVMGAKRREHLVQWDQVRTVMVESSAWDEMLRKYIKIEHRLGGSDEAEMLNHEDVEDPMAVLVALNEVVPNKLAEGVFDYIGHDGEEPLVSIPSIVARTRSFQGKSSLMMLGMGLFMAVFFGSTLLFSFDSRWAVSFNTLVFVPLMDMIVVMYAFMSIRATRNIIEAEAHIDGDCLVLTRGGRSTPVLRVRDTLPLSEVRWVRRSLEPLSFYHRARLDTVNGDTVDVGHQVYRDLLEHPTFRREGIILINDKCEDHGGGLVIEADYVRTSVLALILILVATLSGLISWLVTATGLVGGSIAFDEVLIYIQLVGVSVLSVMFLLLMRSRARKMMLMKDLMATDKGIFIPNAPLGWRFVSREDLDRIRVNKVPLSYTLSLECGDRCLELPLAATDRLREAGFEIEDDQGVLPVKGNA